MLWLLLSDIRENRKMIFMHLGVMIVLTIIIGDGFGLLAIMLMATKVTKSACWQMDIKDSHIGYNQLPAKRWYIVLEKFLLVPVLYLLGYVIWSGIRLLVPSGGFGALNTIGEVVATSFIFLVVIMLLETIYLCMYFAYGALKAQSVGRPIFLSMAVAFMVYIQIVKRRPPKIDTEKYVENLAGAELGQFILISILIFFAIFFIGLFISIHFYNKRDF